MAIVIDVYEILFRNFDILVMVVEVVSLLMCSLVAWIIRFVKVL